MESDGGGAVFRDVARNTRFADVGYDVVSLLDASAVRQLTEVYQRTEGHATSGFHATMYSSQDDYRRSVFQEITRVVTPLLDKYLVDYRLCVANFVVKEPGTTDSEVSLHQDWSFVDERIHRAVHLWFPLTDVDQENGCMQVVPGTHRISKEPREHALVCRYQEVSPLLRERYLRSVPMKAGEGLFYDGALLHGSPPNRSSQRRIAVGCVLVPTSAEVQHAFRVSPSEVEVFAVDDDFFFRHSPGARPENVPCRGRVASSSRQYVVEDLVPLPTTDAARPACTAK